MSTLVIRNVTLVDRRTSLRLEPAMWEALEEVCRREGLTIHELSTVVDARRSESTLTAAMRVFALDYFRRAATEAGHARAGHGRLGAGGARRVMGHAGKPGRAHGAGLHLSVDRPSSQA